MGHSVHRYEMDETGDGSVLDRLNQRGTFKKITKH